MIKKIVYITKVLYRDILSIGMNGSNFYKPLGSFTNGLCIIARELYVRSEDWEMAESFTVSE